MSLLSMHASNHTLILSELLNSRDERQARQKHWLASFNGTLISFTAIAPGPIKDTNVTRRIFNQGVQALRHLISKGHYVLNCAQIWDFITGAEAFFSINALAQDIKLATIHLEQTHQLGRLWDIDVIDAQGNILAREDFSYPARPCFICQAPAKECARQRRHPLNELLVYMEKQLDVAEHSI